MTLYAALEEYNARSFVDRRPSLARMLPDLLLESLKHHPELTLKQFVRKIRSCVDQGSINFSIKEFIESCNSWMPPDIEHDDILLGSHHDIPIRLLIQQNFIRVKIDQIFAAFADTSKLPRPELDQKIIRVFSDQWLGSDAETEICTKCVQCNKHTIVDRFAELPLSVSKFVARIRSVFPELVCKEITYLLLVSDFLITRDGMTIEGRFGMTRSALKRCILEVSMSEINKVVKPTNPRINQFIEEPDVLLITPLHRILRKAYQGDRELYDAYDEYIDQLNAAFGERINMSIPHTYYFDRALSKVNKDVVIEKFRPYAYSFDYNITAIRKDIYLILGHLRLEVSIELIGRLMRECKADKHFLDLFLRHKNVKLDTGDLDEVTMEELGNRSPFAISWFVNNIMTEEFYLHNLYVYLIESKLYSPRAYQDVSDVIKKTKWKDLVKVLANISRDDCRTVMESIRLILALDTQIAVEQEKSVDELMKQVQLEDNPKKKKTKAKAIKQRTPEPKQRTPEPKQRTPEPKQRTPEPKQRTPEPKVFKEEEYVPPPIPAAAEVPVVVEPAVELDDEDVCIVCTDAPRTHLLIPCGHRHYCGTCVKPLKKCATCRADVSSYIRVYV